MKFWTSALQPRRRALRFWGGRLLTLVITVLVLGGCARQEPPADIVIANGAEPESLDPAVLTGQPDGRPAAAMFEGLTRLNPVDSTSEPGLAERWDISEDGRTYIFHLRTNAVW